MKTKIHAAILFAAISLLLISCDWMFGKKEKPAALSITGTWKIDSVYSTTSDTNKNAMAFLVLAIAAGKDSIHTVQFNADSTWKFLQDSSAKMNKYYVKDSSLFVQEDSSFAPFKMNFVKDSSLMLTDKDSLVIVLQKQ